MVDSRMCTGCGACVAICKHGCITMHLDDYGFYRPVVNSLLCTKCGLCNKCCPVENPPEKHSKGLAFAAQNLDAAILKNSSSGGVFSALSQVLFDKSGVVYGVELDSALTPVHSRIDCKNDLYKLQGSKYVQSNVMDSFSRVYEDLRKGIPVLFSGTPCQVAGLKAYLGRDFDNLFTVDLVCHGVSSVHAWKAYLAQREIEEGSKIISASFRNKTYGWNRFSMFLKFSNGNEYCEELHKDSFLRAFLANLFLNDVCGDCHFKGMNRTSDLTLADFWGVEDIQSVIKDDRGVSLVFVNSNKGEKVLEEAEKYIRLQPVSTIEGALNNNLAAIKSVSHHGKRENFFRFLNAGVSFDNAVKKSLTRNLASRIVAKMQRMIGESYDKH